MPKNPPKVLEARHTYKSAMSNRPVIQYFKIKTRKKLQLNCRDAKKTQKSTEIQSQSRYTNLSMSSCAQVIWETQFSVQR